jgi:GDPmannose 4,6-dehydratase
MKVIVTGAQGQDGAILIQNLLNKGYDVIGVGRRRLDDFSARDSTLINCQENPMVNFSYQICDLRDSTTVHELVEKVKPDVIFNLAAISSVSESWDNPAGTLSNDTHSVVNLLDSVRLLSKETRLIQACTAAIYHSSDFPIHEESLIKITNPYAAAKFAAYTICDQYRTRYGLRVSNAIMFNHESIWRPDAFVTRKISKSIARIVSGKQKKMKLWTLTPVRDWGWAEEFMEGLRLMGDVEESPDLIFATGVGASLEEYVKYCFQLVNLEMEEWLEIDPSGLNTGVDISIGNANKAKSVLGWEAKLNWRDIAERMLEHDLQLEKNSRSGI